jgi:cysteine-rich repeat protein
MTQSFIIKCSFLPFFLFACDASVNLGDRDGTDRSDAGVGGAAAVAGDSGVGGITENAVRCGNGNIETDESCDDSNTTNGDGCNAKCGIEAGFICPSPGLPCTSLSQCGDGIVTGNEQCDLGVKNGTDDSCTVTCTRPSQCGNFVVEAGEECDDGNTVGSDGCSATCVIESGYNCPNPGDACIPSVCGNGVVETGEVCDDGNVIRADGCNAQCTAFESGFTCIPGQPCVPVCGDGIVAGGEQCDLGLANGTGNCAADCTLL